MIKDRPKIKIEDNGLDRFLKILAWAGWLLLILLPILYFNDLPDQIPRHYGIDGQADAWAGKNIIWTLPIIGTGLFFLLFFFLFLKRLSWMKVTEENAKELYTSSARLLNVLNVIIIYSFSYIAFQSMQDAIGEPSGLGSWFLPVFLILIFGVVGYFYVKSKKAGSN